MHAYGMPVIRSSSCEARSRTLLFTWLKMEPLAQTDGGGCGGGEGGSGRGGSGGELGGGGDGG